MVVVIVRKDDHINGRQPVELDPWRHPPTGTGEPNGRCSLAPDGIRKNVESGQLNQKTGVPNPGKGQLFGIAAWHREGRVNPDKAGPVGVWSAGISSSLD